MVEAEKKYLQVSGSAQSSGIRLEKSAELRDVLSSFRSVQSCSECRIPTTQERVTQITKMIDDIQKLEYEILQFNEALTNPLVKQSSIAPQVEAEIENRKAWLDLVLLRLNTWKVSVKDGEFR